MESNLSVKLNSKSSISSKPVLCCLLSEDICISFRNTSTNHFTPAFVFLAQRGPLLVQLVFRKAVSTSIFAQACLFILAGREHTPELRKSTDPHGLRLLLSRNTMQDGGEGGSNAAKNSSALIQTGPVMVLLRVHLCIHLALRMASHYQSRMKRTERHINSKLQQSPGKCQWDLIPLNP